MKGYNIPENISFSDPLAPWNQDYKADDMEALTDAIRAGGDFLEVMESIEANAPGFAPEFIIRLKRQIEELKTELRKLEDGE